MKYLLLLLLITILSLSACAKTQNTTKKENLLTTCEIDSDCKKSLICEKMICANETRRNLLIQENANNQCKTTDPVPYKPPSLGECKCINNECQFE